jgi:threonine/homoserine/homoserine lactone efflux protein
VTLDLLLIGLAITLEPIPLTSFILVLASKNGTRKAAAFILGWLLSLVAVVAATLALTSNNPPKSGTAPSVAALVIKILIGIVLLLIALRQWRRLGKPKKPKKTPKWRRSIDAMSPAYAMALGPLTQPWGLVAAGVATIVSTKLSSWESALALVMFCLVATAAYLAMEVYAVLRPVPSHEFLTRLRAWIDTHTDQVIIVVSLVLGIWLIGHSLYLIVA